MTFWKLLRDLRQLNRLHLFIALALTALLASLLFLSQVTSSWPVAEAAPPATAIIIEDAESVLIVNLNARQQAENQDEPEHAFSLAFTNKQAFTTEDSPKITFEGFTFVEAGSNAWEFAAADEQASYLAHTWISGPQTLADLAEDAVNSLDFVIDVPQTTKDGSYTSAVVIRDQADAILGYQLLLINIGSFEPKDDLDLAQSGFDLKTGQELSVVVANEGQWHAHGSVELKLTDGSDSLSTKLTAQHNDFVGIFPAFEATFIIDSAPDIKALEDFVAQADDLKAEIVFLDAESQEELAVWDVGDEFETTPNEEDDSKPENDDTAQSAATNETGDGTTQTSTSSGISTFLVDNIFIIVGAGGILVLVIILLIMRRRKQGAQFKTLDKKVSSPTAASPAASTPAATPPLVANEQPAITLPSAATETAGNATTPPATSTPADTGDLNISAADLVIPQPAATETAGKAPAPALSDSAASPAPVDHKQAPPTTPMAAPALEGMPQLPTIDESSISSASEDKPVPLSEIDTTIAPPPDMESNITPPPDINTNITPPSDSDKQPPPPEQNPI